MLKKRFQKVQAKKANIKSRKKEKKKLLIVENPSKEVDLVQESPTNKLLDLEKTNEELGTVFL